MYATLEQAWGGAPWEPHPAYAAIPRTTAAAERQPERVTPTTLSVEELEAQLQEHGLTSAPRVTQQERIALTRCKHCKKSQSHQKKQNISASDRDFLTVLLLFLFVVLFVH